MGITLHATSARKLIVELAKKLNDHKGNNTYQNQIDISKVENTGTDSKITSKLWSVLYPAYAENQYSIQRWNDEKKDNPSLYKAIIEDYKDRKLNIACTYDVIYGIVRVSKSAPKEKLSVTPNRKAIEKICEYLEVNDILQLIHDDKPRLEENHPNSPLLNTKWYGYYRTRIPNSKQIKILKCCVFINFQGQVEIKNAANTNELRKLPNYKGFIEQGKNQIILKVKEKISLDYGYMIFSAPSTVRMTNVSVLYGVFLQTVPHNFATHVRSIILVKSDDAAEEMNPSSLNIVKTTEKENYIFPFKNNYRTVEEKVTRLLFDRGHNYLATLARNLSKSKDFNKSLRKWDTDFTIKSRPVFDIYISCPVTAYSDSDERFENIKSQVMKLKTQLLDSIIFNDYNYEEGSLVVRTAFDDDKLPTRTSKNKLINPKFVSQEIQSTSLFVLFYPDPSIVTSCIVEASWAVQAGVPCLFVVDKEEHLPRYLRKSAFIKEYPIYVSEGKNFTPSELADNRLGASISFK